MFSGIVTVSNAKKAAPIAGVVYLAILATKSQHPIVQGLAAVAAAMVALPFASKL